MSVKQFNDNPGFMNGLFMVADALAILAPGVPGGAGALAKFARNSKNAIVIGEDMSRVRKAAKILGAEAFEGSTKMGNKLWIKFHKAFGSTVYDIGPAFDRRFDRFLAGKTPYSEFYNLERAGTVDYNKVIKLWQREGKFQGRSIFD